MNWMRAWRTAAVGALAVLVLGAAAVGIGTQPEDLSEIVAGHAVPPSSGEIQPNLLLGCGDTPLRTILPHWSGRASVVLANVRLTAVRSGPYQKMTLESVRTLAGPHIPDGANGWIQAHSYYVAGLPLDSQPRYPDDLGALWGPDGHALAFYDWGSDTVGPRLILAPVAGDQVVFSQAGCWNVDGLPSRAYKGAVAQVPGSHTYELAAQSAMGLRAVPLAVIVGLLSAPR